MAAATRALTPTSSGPFSSTVPTAPDTPTSISSHTAGAKSLAPSLATAVSLRASASPRSQKSALSPRYSPQPLTGAAALEDERQLREQRAREESRQISPNPAAVALRQLLDQGQAGVTGATTQLSEPVAQMAQKIDIPETGPAANDNLQTSPTSMSSVASIDQSTAPTTTAPVMAPNVPQPADNAFSEEDPNASRPAVDPGVSGPSDSRAFTFPPAPADDPRNPHRNMSLPTTGYGNSSPKAQGAKRHRCPYCSTVFTRHHNLKSHLLTHSQEKPYECQECQSRFRRLHDLKRHTKLHTGERPHECPKCGRKFARGDALARHNKGQGGCAGRRSDFGLEEGDDSRVDDSMDGVEYTQEPEHIDEDGENGSRRGSHVSRRQDSGPYRAGPSTYPPLGQNSIAPMYPPPPGPHSSSSPQLHPSTLPHFANAQGFGGPGVTESPKPLSPGHPDQRGNASGPTRSYPPQYVQGAARGGAPQLPPLPQSFGGMPPPGAASHPGSMSSHSGSGGSGREVLGGGRDQEWWNYVREMESRIAKKDEEHLATVARIQNDHSRLESEYRARIAQLEEDNKALQDSQTSLNKEISTLKTKLESASSA